MTEPQAPRVEILLTYEELAVAAGIRPTVLERLIRLGVVEPARPEAAVFTVDTLARVRHMLRLHAQLGVNFTGAAIIVDLLERLHRLERGAVTPPARPSSSGSPPESSAPHAAPPERRSS